MEAFITINCSNYSDNIIDIINLFQEIGWEIYNSKGEIEFLPIGDDDKYDWQREKMSVENFYEIVSKKLAQNEQVGVDLFYKGTEGISLLAFNTEQILLSIIINRKLLDKCHTDMRWYLEHIIYKFFECGVNILSYNMEEYED